MLNIDTFSLGDLQTNCYILSDSSSSETLVIDPADEGEFIASELLHRGLQLKSIVLTHGHFDHVLGLLALVSSFPPPDSMPAAKRVSAPNKEISAPNTVSVPIYLHPNDRFLIKQAQSSAFHWLHRSVDPVPLPTADLIEKTKLRLGRIGFSLLLTPGHTPGSVCLYAKADRALFCGDTVFKDGVGRTDFRYSDAEELRQSLQKITSLPEDVIVYPGHGEATSIGEIRQTLTGQAIADSN